CLRIASRVLSRWYSASSIASVSRSTAATCCSSAANLSLLSAHLRAHTWPWHISTRADHTLGSLEIAFQTIPILGTKMRSRPNALHDRLPYGRDWLVQNFDNAEFFSGFEHRRFRRARDCDYQQIWI